MRRCLTCNAWEGKFPRGLLLLQQENILGARELAICPECYGSYRATWDELMLEKLIECLERRIK